MKKIISVQANPVELRVTAETPTLISDPLANRASRAKFTKRLLALFGVSSMTVGGIFALASLAMHHKGKMEAEHFAVAIASAAATAFPIAVAESINRRVNDILSSGNPDQIASLLTKMMLSREGKYTLLLDDEEFSGQEMPTNMMMEDGVEGPSRGISPEMAKKFSSYSSNAKAQALRIIKNLKSGDVKSISLDWGPALFDAGIVLLASILMKHDSEMNAGHTILAFGLMVMVQFASVTYTSVSTFKNISEVTQDSVISLQRQRTQADADTFTDISVQGNAWV